MKLSELPSALRQHLCKCQVSNYGFVEERVREAEEAMADLIGLYGDVSVRWCVQRGIFIPGIPDVLLKEVVRRSIRVEREVAQIKSIMSDEAEIVAITLDQQTSMEFKRMLESLHKEKPHIPTEFVLREVFRRGLYHWQISNMIHSVEGEFEEAIIKKLREIVEGEKI